MAATQPQTSSAAGTFGRFWDLLNKLKSPGDEPTMSAGAAYLEVPVTTHPPERLLVVPRQKAEAELQSLLDEIPTWPDAMLVHMHKRFATSRLFRVHHEPDGPLTARAVALRDAAFAEMQLRGLQPRPQD